MKAKLSLITLICSSFLFADTNALNGVEAQKAFNGYEIGDKEIHQKIQKAGFEASVSEVSDIINSKKGKWAVVDIRPKDEYMGASISGVRRIGRETPEFILQEFFLEIDTVEENGTKKKIVKKRDIDGIVLMCRTGTRASFDWASYVFAGFGDKVKVFSLVKWIESCNPVQNGNNGQVETAQLADKKINLIKAKDGMYYKQGCPAVADLK